MENETKARIFAQYYGQNIGIAKSSAVDKLFGIKENNSVYAGKNHLEIEKWYKLSACQLLLKPLSAITDEDAIQVGEIIMGKYKPLQNGKAFIKEIQGSTFNSVFHPFNTLRAFQYLQSKGYALPYMEYSVEQLVQMGVYKLIE